MAIVLAACGATGEPAVTAPRPDAPATAPAPCPAEPGAPALDYNDIEIGGSYFVDVEQRAGEWAPAGHVPMPHHHATRIEWTNPERLAGLGDARGRLRFTLTVESREIRPVSGRQAWRVTVKARITAICAPG